MNTSATWFQFSGRAAQAEYEVLRAHVLAHGVMPVSQAAVRFARRGLAGLVRWSAGEPVFEAELVGARRPPWTPGRDPRIEVLAAAFVRLLEAADRQGTGEDGGQGRWVR